ncbi:MAG TPA: hypothetical protein VIN77_13335 [Aurantimonas sp.]
MGMGMGMGIRGPACFVAGLFVRDDFNLQETIGGLGRGQEILVDHIVIGLEEFESVSELAFRPLERRKIMLILDPVVVFQMGKEDL